MVTHPYLLIGDSTYREGGKVIGSSTSKKFALTNTSVTEVQVPSYFDNKPVIEIGYGALAYNDNKIKKIFVPKTVLFINEVGFNSCFQLTEVRFEEGSRLEKIGLYAFAGCYKLMKIDIPSSVKTIIAPNTGHLFYSNTIKECISYLGTADLSSLSLFNYVPSAIYVSSSYQSTLFGGKQATKNDRTCGVSRNPLQYTPRRTKIKKRSIVSRYILQYMLLVISS